MDRAYLDDLRAGVRAADAKFTRKQVAEKAGFHEQTLSRFMSGGTLGSKVEPKLRVWLEKEGFYPPPAARTTAPGSTSVSETGSASPASIIAGELRALAAFLESPAFDDDAKVERFRNAITGYHATVKAFEAALKKGKKDGG